MLRLNYLQITFQAQLENSHRFESYSVYESVDQDQQQPQKSRLSNCCACVKMAFTIAIVLAVSLGLFVVIPLKVIFSPTET